MNRNDLYKGLLAISLLTPFAPASDRPSIAATSPTPATYTWTVRGRMIVEHQISTLGATSALAGIKVKLQVRAKTILGIWGSWNSWGTDVTDAGGYFKFTADKNGKDRQFRVSVKFDSDDLELRHETATSSLTKVKWYRVLERSGIKGPGSFTLGEFRFEAGGDDALGDSEPRAHADIWCVATRAMDRLASYGSNYAFSDKVKIKYPHESDAFDLTGSYANPYTKVVYLLREHLNAKTILHEMMHVYSYQKGTQEAVLFEYLVAHKTTDGTTSRAVAFLEGFAWYGAENLLAEEFGEDIILPLNRAYLSGTLGLTTLAKAAKHDDGWLSMLRAMSCDAILYKNFYQAGSSVSSDFVVHMPFILVDGDTIDPPELSFKNVLRVFRAHSGAGLDAIAFRGVTVDTFLERARKILSGLDSTQASGLKELFKPDSEQQPWDVFIH